MYRDGHYTLLIQQGYSVFHQSLRREVLCETVFALVRGEGTQNFVQLLIANVDVFRPIGSDGVTS